MAEDLEFFTAAVPFKIDGKPYKGRMTATAWGELGKVWGIVGLQAMQKRLEAIEMSDMGDIVWASLLKYQPKTTRAQGAEIADAMGMGVAKYVSQVVSAALPPGEAMVKGPTKPAIRRRKAR